MDRQILWGSADLWPVSGRQPHFKIVEAVTYVRQRFAAPTLRLSDAARHAQLSPTHLARLLKTTTGLTFLQHLRRARIDHAEHLLLTTLLSIKEVAARCGYAASGSFSRDFRRVHTCTPTEWRTRERCAHELHTPDTNCEAIGRTAS